MPTCYGGKEMDVRWFGKVLPPSDVDSITDRLYSEAATRAGVMKDRIRDQNKREKPKKLVFKTYDMHRGKKVDGHFVGEYAEVASLAGADKDALTSRMYDQSIVEKQAKMQKLYDKYMGTGRGRQRMSAVEVYGVGRESNPNRRASAGV
mmetsp:Transcript_57005/g.180415  ORF Transcript_57005/g.180415 Transcript_57005/m.180415 type:complete len:149 (+) Transcript_57005:446-892(+)